MIGRDCFRQCEIEQHCIRETERGSEEERNVNAPLAQDAADGWSKNKSQPKRRADQPHAFGAILFGGDVGDVRLRCRDVAASDAVEYAPDEKHQKRFCQPEYEKADARADDRQQQHRTPSILV